MILTLLRIHWTNLRRDRVAQMLTFVVPMAFFTIFALIFGGRGGGVTGRVHLALVDESHTPTSERLVRALQAEKSLIVLTRTRTARDTTRVPIDRARAEQLVRGGRVPVALVLQGLVLLIAIGLVLLARKAAASGWIAQRAVRHG